MLLIEGSVIGLFFFDKLYSPVGLFIGVGILFVVIANSNINKTNSARVFGGYMLAVTLVFAWNNYEPNWGIESVVFLDLEYPFFVFRTISTIFLFGVSFYYLMINRKFSRIRKTYIFRVVIVILGVCLLLELPLYDIHGDIGGNSHGHSFWKGRGHLH